MRWYHAGMKQSLIVPATILLSIVFAFCLSYVLAVQIAKASAPSGLMATVATSSVDTVGTSASMIAATSTCAARIVSTTASPIMLYFSDFKGQRPTGIAGHQQAASTTVAYDGGIYGCGAVYAYSFTSGPITITETR